MLGERRSGWHGGWQTVMITGLGSRYRDAPINNQQYTPVIHMFLTRFCVIIDNSLAIHQIV